ncbi:MULTISPECIES: hypothetical protein [Serratia]|jgi:hypothetical protein|uniref:Uncharacterized protein n=1 Tax=Serratia fonticola TaxID=47917 RepID=A0AAE7EHS5_SERFO|nr:MULTISPECIES: hypothetical protein [Serratia]MBC3219063.1 hypothetical protein [Serratia fonticola]MBC3227696.1 hypothetical protein [Serratia fonticola]MCO7511307.1 hypothetical protein [Serratia fonticola]NBJ34562.1 hypothetical protein [Serratia fonticola]NCG50604.1 hypothetical protein [Serratia fonticola]
MTINSEAGGKDKHQLREALVVGVVHQRDILLFAWLNVADILTDSIDEIK